MTVSQSKQQVVDARKEFFEDVVSYLRAPARAIDDRLEQVKYYYEPQDENLITDAEYGDFYIEINPFFHGKTWPLAYSMWQIGEELRIAIILHSSTEATPLLEPVEFGDLWGESKMDPQFRGNRLFLEWRFAVPGFHSDYAVREKYALGMRHMHFRILKSVRQMAGRVAAHQALDGESGAGRESTDGDLGDASP